MNTTPSVRTSLTTSQETVQTALLIIVSVVSTWIALYRVPWHVSGDPCLLAAAISGIVVTSLWLTRWRGVRGANIERNVLAGFLVLMPLVYLTRYLFASREGAANFWFWIEVLGTAIFIALAVLGVKRSPWFLASGMMLHGLAWDSWHYRNSTYIPDWYVMACLMVDLAFGAYVVARVPAYRTAARIATAN